MPIPQQITVIKTKKTKKKKSKCHGNTKLHHLKRKWRTQGITEERIQVLIKKRQLHQSMELDTCDDDDDDDDGHHHQELESTTTKRKRDDRSSQLSMAGSIRSLSQLSLSQRSRKRQRTTTEESSSMADNLSDMTTIDLKLEKYSKYLRMPRKLLLRSLQLQLHCRRLKRKDEQNYLLRRLQLIDEHFCVDLIRYLYQSYWDLSSSVNIWPVSEIDR
jgi:hypothetical protein